MPALLDSIVDFINKTRFRMSSDSRARVWTRIGALSRAGVPITNALDFLNQSQTGGSAAARFIQHQRFAMRSVGFSAGARGWVPQEELTIIEITQEGRIAEGFEQAARIASVRYKLRTTLFSGLTYPILLLFGGGIIIALLPGFALDVMVEIVEPNRWPAVSRSILSFSSFVSNWGAGVVILFVLFISLSIWAAPRWTGTIRKRLDWFPLFVVYRQFTGPEVLTAWLALMQAGIQRIRALSQLERSLPEYLAFHVRTMRSQLYRGEPVETALNTGLFSKETLDDLRIYERVGDFSIHASNIAQDDIDRALEKLQSMTKAISSILLILIAAAGIWIYFGIAQIALTVQNTIY